LNATDSEHSHRRGRTNICPPAIFSALLRADEIRVIRVHERAVFIFDPSPSYWVQGLSSSKGAGGLIPPDSAWQVSVCRSCGDYDPAQFRVLYTTLCESARDRFAWTSSSARVLFLTEVHRSRQMGNGLSIAIRRKSRQLSTVPLREPKQTRSTNDPGKRGAF